MATSDRIASLLAPVVEDLGYEFVGLEYSSNPKNRVLRVYIDEPDKGIDLSDCETVSREISATLDVEDPVTGQYTLEVSSPGVERPLFTAEHFERFIGEMASVQLHAPQDGRRRFKGTIVAVDGDTVHLDVDGTVRQLAVADMDKARLAPDMEALFGNDK